MEKQQCKRHSEQALLCGYSAAHCIDFTSKKDGIASEAKQSRLLLRSNNNKQLIDNIKNCSAILPGLLRPLSGLAMTTIYCFLTTKKLKSIHATMSCEPYKKQGVALQNYNMPKSSRLLWIVRFHEDRNDGFLFSMPYSFPDLEPAE